MGEEEELHVGNKEGGVRGGVRGGRRSESRNEWNEIMLASSRFISVFFDNPHPPLSSHSPQRHTFPFMGKRRSERVEREWRGSGEE